jgi:hypothetical protein
MKLTLLALALALALAPALALQADIFSTGNTQSPTADTIAAAIKSGCAAELKHRVGQRQQSWQAFWCNPSVDPISLAASSQWGTGELAQYIGVANADAAVMNAAASALGKSLSDFLASVPGLGANFAQYYSPPSAYTVAVSGVTVTITLNAGWSRAVVNGQVVLTGPGGVTIKP